MARLFFTFVTVISLVVVGAGFAVIVSALNRWRLARRAARWPQVDGVVLESKVERTVTPLEEGDRPSAQHLPTFRPAIRYRYQVGEQTFEGLRWSLLELESSDESAAKSAVETHPVGTKLTVFYQPDLPSNSIINQAISKTYVAGVAVGVGLIFFGFGVALMVQRLAGHL